jgi:hypothetical protein
MNRIVAPRLLVGLLGAALFTGCSNDPPIGDIEIPFEIGVVAAMCSEVDAVEVRMTLTQILEEGGPPSPQTEITPCDDGKVVFSGINAGKYELLAEALAADGVVILDNLRATTRTVEVLEETTVTASAVTLTFTPAQLLVAWELRKGGFQAQCANVDTKKFEISAARTGGIEPLGAPHVFGCEDAADAFPYHTVPDLMRELDGSTLDTVVIQPMDAAGAKLGAKLSVPLVAPPGHGRPVQIRIVCEDEVCTAGQVP